MKQLFGLVRGKGMRRYFAVLGLVGILATVAYAGSVPNTFTSGTTIKSSEVNANFSYLGSRSWDISGSSLYYTGGNVGIGTSSPSSESLHIQSPSFTDAGGATTPQMIMDTANSQGYLRLGSTGPYDRSASNGMIPGVIGGSPTSTGHFLLLGAVDSAGDTGNLPVVIVSAWGHSSGFSGSTSINNRSLFGVANYNALKFVIDKSGYVGIGTTSPSYPLHMSSGAYVTTGGTWTNASSRDYKTDINKLSTEKAMDAFAKLQPVTFKYKTDETEKHIGFIAEDVPDLVATKGRKGLSPMDMVALLTKVVQEQQKTIAHLQERLNKIETQRAPK